MPALPFKLILACILIGCAGISSCAPMPSNQLAEVTQIPLESHHESVYSAFAAVATIRHVESNYRFSAINEALSSLTKSQLISARSNEVQSLDLSGNVVLFLTGFLGCRPPAVPELREMVQIQSMASSDLRVFGLHFNDFGEDAGRREALMLRKVLRADFPYLYTTEVASLVAAASVPSVLVIKDGEVRIVYALSGLPALEENLDEGVLIRALRRDASPS